VVSDFRCPFPKEFCWEISWIFRSLCQGLISFAELVNNKVIIQPILNSFATFQIKSGKITTGFGQVPTNLLNSYNNGFKDYSNVLILNISVPVHPEKQSGAKKHMTE